MKDAINKIKDAVSRVNPLLERRDELLDVIKMPRRRLSTNYIDAIRAIARQYNVNVVELEGSPPTFLPSREGVYRVGNPLFSSSYTDTGLPFTLIVDVRELDLLARSVIDYQMQNKEPMYRRGDANTPTSIQGKATDTYHKLKSDVSRYISRHFNETNDGDFESYFGTNYPPGYFGPLPTHIENTDHYNDSARKIVEYINKMVDLKQVQYPVVFTHLYIDYGISVSTCFNSQTGNTSEIAVISLPKMYNRMGYAECSIESVCTEMVSKINL